MYLWILWALLALHALLLAVVAKIVGDAAMQELDHPTDARNVEGWHHEE